MHDERLIKILVQLQIHGLGDSQNIKDLINEVFPVPQTESEFNTVRAHVNSFLSKINKIDRPAHNPQDGYIQFDPSLLNSIKQWRDMPNTWFNAFNASITDKGIETLTEHKKIIEQSIVSKSVQDTNLAMVKNFEEQAKTNNIIADNSTTQTKILDGQAEILKRQTWIFFATAIFALLACIIAWFSLRVEIIKDQSEKQLQQQTKEIKELRIRIKTLMNDTSVVSTAKKTPPKKK